MPQIRETSRLKDLWNEEHAKKMAANQLAMLRYRSNLLGADLRITNFGGGNTSSKIELPDPFTGKNVRVLAVKGSGGAGKPGYGRHHSRRTWAFHLGNDTTRMLPELDSHY